jgi:hypothetical protein
MSSVPCEGCGDPTPDPLHRSVQLRVDGVELDEQTLCPDCFSDWIARYQNEMADDLPGSGGPETTGDDIRIADEDESVRSHQGALDDVRLREAVSGTGDEIRDLATGSHGDGNEDLAVDPDATAVVPDDEEDDGDALFD